MVRDQVGSADLDAMTASHSPKDDRQPPAAHTAANAVESIRLLDSSIPALNVTGPGMLGVINAVCGGCLVGLTRDFDGTWRAWITDESTAEVVADVRAGFFAAVSLRSRSAVYLFRETNHDPKVVAIATALLERTLPLP